MDKKYFMQILMSKNVPEEAKNMLIKHQSKLQNLEILEKYYFEKYYKEQRDKNHENFIRYITKIIKISTAIIISILLIFYIFS